MVFSIAKSQWPFVTPQNFGGGADATDAQNDAAFAAMIATGLPMLIPPTNPGEFYLFSDTIVLPQFSSFLGAGFYQSVKFKKRDKTTPAFQVGGRFEFGNLWAEFEDTITDTDTAANLVNIKGAELSVIKPLRLYNAYNGMYLLQEDGIGTPGTSNFFQNQVETVYVTDCAKCHIDLSTYGESLSTGNFFGNLRSDNQARGPIPNSMRFVKFSGSVVANMNIEGGEYSSHPLVVSGDSFDIKLLHYEGLVFTQWGVCALGAAGYNLNIGSFNLLRTEIADGAECALASLGEAGIVQIDALREIDTVLGAGSAFNAVYYYPDAISTQDVGIIVRKKTLDGSHLTNNVWTGGGGAGQTGLVKQWGTT